MAALLLIVGSAIVTLLFFAVVVRVAQFLGLLAILLFCAACTVIGYASLAAFGIAFAMFYEFLGVDHIGAAWAGAGSIGLLVAWSMAASVIGSIKSIPARLQRWADQGNTHAASNSDTRERTSS